MIFEILFDAANHDELILVDGGMCHYHLRKDGQVTIREIIVLKDRQRKGVGTAIVDSLKRLSGATSIFAKCPSELPANKWYPAIGFVSEGVNLTKNGKELSLWRLPL